MAQVVNSLPSRWEIGFDLLVGKIPWRREWLTTPVLLPGEFHGQRSLVGYSPWGHEESDTIDRVSLLLFECILENTERNRQGHEFNFHFKS